MTDWSPQQEQALRDCKRWMSDASSQVFYLAGYAGTGKTTLAKHLVGGSDRWLFGAYTGKAAYVLRQKGCHGASTIHSLIYRPAGESRKAELLDIESRIIKLELEEQTEAQQKELFRLRRVREDLTSANKPMFALWLNSPLADSHIEGIVIDEVSMVDSFIAHDLESFGKKILVLGDPAQLPPVGAGGYYTKRKPDFTLTEVHRHAKYSGILRLATHVRTGGVIQGFQVGDSTDVEIVEQPADKEILAQVALAADQILVGMNKTRHTINYRHRQLQGYGPGPQLGERLVCLRNDHDLGVFNGSQWVVKGSDPNFPAKTVWLELEGEDTGLTIEADSWLHHMLGIGDDLKQMSFHRRELCEFDWSYALTVHKAQGSQWEKVLLFDQSKVFRNDAARWLYTGITRASEKLIIVI